MIKKLIVAPFLVLGYIQYKYHSFLAATLATNEWGNHAKSMQTARGTIQRKIKLLTWWWQACVSQYRQDYCQQPPTPITHTLWDPNRFPDPDKLTRPSGSVSTNRKMIDYELMQ